MARRTDQQGKATRADIDRLVSFCIGKGWTVRHHTHPKTRVNWLGRKK